MTNSAAESRGCDYCGLPIAGSADEGPQYCCLGCRLAAGIAAEQGEEGQARWLLARLGIAVFFSMIVMVFSLALWSQDVYELETTATSRTLLELFRAACLLATAPVLLLLGGPLLENAWESARQRRLATDALLAVGVLAAFLVSARSVVVGEGPVYFEICCVVLLAVTLGRWLEATGKLRTTEALRGLESLLPQEARVIQPGDSSGGQGELIPLAAVTVGQWLRILPGERIPVDGVIRRNQAAIDEQVVTGESQPAIKETGDRVLAGSLNLDGDLWVEVTASPNDGTLQRLVQAVCAAALARGSIQRMADRVAAIFLPAVVGIALLTLAVHGRRGDWETGWLAALSVLLIACPCALGIATPLALWAAMGKAARAGVLFRDGDALHRLARTRQIVFDKTGTLTTGEPQLLHVHCESGAGREPLLAAAGRLAAASAHPLSRVIRDFVDPPGGEAEGLGWVEQPRLVPGRGITASDPLLGSQVFLGSARFLREEGLDWSPELEAALEKSHRSGAQVVCVGWGGKGRGIFTFREQLRPAAREALHSLQQSGLEVAVLTGDHFHRGECLAQELGVAVESDLLPTDKAARISERHQRSPVAMVGDGLNDAPALATADAGIALGCGADVSRDTADVCLLGNDLRTVPWAWKLARATMRTVHQNLFWTFVYNSLGIGLAAAGWLNPIWAAAAMVVSSLLVISNSWRLTVDRELEAPGTPTRDEELPPLSREPASTEEVSDGNA